MMGRRQKTRLKENCIVVGKRDQQLDESSSLLCNERFYSNSSARVSGADIETVHRLQSLSAQRGAGLAVAAR